MPPDGDRTQNAWAWRNSRNYAGLVGAWRKVHVCPPVAEPLSGTRQSAAESHLRHTDGFKIARQDLNIDP